MVYVPYYEKASEDVKKYLKNMDTADRYLKSRDHIHLKAVSASAEHLYEDKFLFTEHLTDANKRKTAIDAALKVYEKEYKEITGIEPESKDSALLYFTGKDTQTLDKILQQNSESKDLELNDLYDIMKQIPTREGPKDYHNILKENLYSASGSHLKDEHLEDIIDFLNKDRGIDKHTYKDKITLDDAKELVQVYRKFGGIDKNYIHEHYNRKGKNPIFIKQQTAPYTNTEFSDELEDAAKGPVFKENEIYDDIKNHKVDSERLNEILTSGEDYEKEAVERALNEGEMSEENQKELLRNITLGNLRALEAGQITQKQFQNNIENYMKNNKIVNSAKEEINNILREIHSQRQGQRQNQSQPQPNQDNGTGDMQENAKAQSSNEEIAPPNEENNA
ncbi:MAG: hypothetical protein ACQESF_04275 [Nanobdellota archaeon]